MNETYRNLLKRKSLRWVPVCAQRLVAAHRNHFLQIVSGLVFPPRVQISEKQAFVCVCAYNTPAYARLAVTKEV